MSRITRSKRSQQLIDDNVRPSTSSGLPRVLSQDSGERRITRSSISENAKIVSRNALSQGSINLDSEGVPRERTRTLESTSISLQDEMDLAGRIIRYLFIVEKKKHAVQKLHIMKNIVGVTSKNFRHLMEIVGSLLSKVFGYKLVDIGGNKYILVNEIKNNLPHLKFKKSVKKDQVLLFIILAHIFMCEDSCREESLWDFLQHLEIIQEDNYRNDYFGDVKKLVTMDFTSQHYLERVMVDKGENPKYELRWGSRAEYEVSRRDVLEFISKIYGNRPINSWTQQYKAMLEDEKSKKK